MFKLNSHMRHGVRLQFTLRGLLLLVGCVGASIGLYGVHLRERIACERALQAAQDMGALTQLGEADVSINLVNAHVNTQVFDELVKNLGRSRRSVRVALGSSGASECKFLESLARLESLIGLELDGDAWTTDSFAGVSRLRGLKVLSLRCPGIDDNSLRHLRQLRDLTTVFLDDTKVTGPGISSLRNSKHLTCLSLRNTLANDVSLKYVVDIHTLTSLDVRGTAITGNGLVQLLNDLPKLYSILLDERAMSDALIEYLRAGARPLMLHIGEGIADSDRIRQIQLTMPYVEVVNAPVIWERPELQRPVSVTGRSATSIFIDVSPSRPLGCTDERQLR